jgi:predicted dehydrogenase
VGAPEASSRAYGSYRELVADAGVDVVYVGTTHSHHYQHARAALEAGKHVVCEKAFTVTAAQAEVLVRVAAERGRFLMEAVWTRFFPAFRTLSDRVRAGQLVRVERVFADVGFWHEFGEREREERMMNVDLAGGVLLDRECPVRKMLGWAVLMLRGTVGVYALTWVFEFLYHIAPPAARAAPPKVAAAMTLFDTGADETCSIVVTFPTGTHGIATSSLRVSLPRNPRV